MTASAWTLRALWTVSPHHLQVIVVNAAVALFGIWTVVTLPETSERPTSCFSFANCSEPRLVFRRQPTLVTTTPSLSEAPAGAVSLSRTGHCQSPPALRRG